MFDIEKILTGLQTDPKMQRNAAIAGAGAVALGLLSGSGGRKLVGGAAKYGAVAALGGLAYHAWQQHQAKKAGGAADPGPGAAPGWSPMSPDAETLPPPPADSGFAVPTAPNEADRLSRNLVRAMITAAKADGKIDAEEKARIFARLNEMDIDAGTKAFVFDELSAPLNLEAVIADVKSPQEAAEVYAASLVAIEDNTAAEKAYLQMLAARLGLEDGLVVELHRAARGEPATV